MHFSAVAILLAGTATAELARRVPAPYTPRSLAKRQTTADCNGLLKQGDVCCGIVNGSANGCAAGQVCANEGDYWWCCPGDTPNCERPAAACGDNNGGCGEGYTCSAGDEGGRGAQCVQASAASGGDASSTEEAATTETTTTTVVTTDGGDDTTPPAEGETPPAEGETPPPAEGETAPTDGSETAPPPANETSPVPAPPTSGGNKFTGVSALAFAVMAGVFFL